MHMWLLWLTIEMSLLELGVLALLAQMGLENATLILQGFISGNECDLGSEWVFFGCEC